MISRIQFSSYILNSRKWKLVSSTWLSKQSLPVEATVVSTMSGVHGAFIGGLMGTISSDTPQTGVNPQAINQAQALVGGPWVQARNFVVIIGVNAGIARVMKRIRGKEDLESAILIAEISLKWCMRHQKPSE